MHPFFIRSFDGERIDLLRDVHCCICSKPIPRYFLAKKGAFTEIRQTYSNCESCFLGKTT